MKDDLIRTDLICNSSDASNSIQSDTIRYNKKRYDLFSCDADLSGLDNGFEAKYQVRAKSWMHTQRQQTRKDNVLIGLASQNNHTLHSHT